MVVIMGGSTQLCWHCHEITERTSDGDRLACSMCGRPYLVAPSWPPSQWDGDEGFLPGRLGRFSAVARPYPSDGVEGWVGGQDAKQASAVPVRP
jgi:hypothetical protein